MAGITFDEFIAQVNAKCLDYPDLRWGQLFFQELSSERQDLTMRIVNTELDPYYIDDRVEILYAWLYENWDKDPIDIAPIRRA